jgi:heme-degrading monooxygenase HmoA
MSRIRVLVWYRAPDGSGDDIERAYHRISELLAGTPGLRGNELLRSTLDAGRFAVLSEWDDLAAFRCWETGATHRSTTAPLMPYLDPPPDRPYAVLEVRAEH